MGKAPRTRSQNFLATLYATLYKEGRFILVDRKWRLRAPESSDFTVRPPLHFPTHGDQLLLPFETIVWGHPVE